jgi:acetyl-CoA carboxylase biotin carboxyl carrier protein
MDLGFVEKLIALVSRSPIAELEIEREGVRVRISKHVPTAAPVGALSSQSGQVSAVTVETAVLAQPSGPIRHLVRAPLTGVFYRAAAEDAPSLVSIGDIVEEGQKIGVLEAMKTFNVVEADRPGRIVECPVENAAAVQSGDVLFVLELVGGD